MRCSHCFQRSTRSPVIKAYLQSSSRPICATPSAMHSPASAQMPSRGSRSTTGRTPGVKVTGFGTATHTHKIYTHTHIYLLIYLVYTKFRRTVNHGRPTIQHPSQHITTMKHVMKRKQRVLGVYPGHLLQTDSVVFYMLNLHDDKSKCPHSQKK